VFDVLAKFSSFHTTIQARLLIGGTSVTEMTSELETFGAHVLVGTPGRIVDIQSRSKKFNFKHLEVRLCLQYKLIVVIINIVFQGACLR